MKLATTKNAKRNISYGLAYKLFQVLSQFLLRSCLIYILGPAYLGIDGLFASVLKVLSMAELGVGGAIIFSMYKPIADDDTETVCALMALFRRLYRIIGLVVLALGLSLLPFLPRLIKGSVPDGLNLTALYLLYLVNTVLSYMVVTYKESVLWALQRDDLVNKALLISQGTLLAFQIAILFLWKNYYLFLLVNPICTLLYKGVVYALCEKFFPQFQPHGQIAPELKRNIVIRTSGIFISHLSTTTRTSFDSVFTAAFLGLVMTAVYNNYLYIILAVTGLMRILTESVRAGIGNSVALNSLRRNYHDMEKMNFLFMSLSGWASACILCLVQPFMCLWVGARLVLPVGSALLFVLYFYLLRIGDIRSLYVNATGIWWELRYRAILESASNILLNYFLGKRMGLPGILLATIISLVLFNILYGSPFLFRLYFKEQRVTDYFGQQAVYLVAAAACCAVTAGACIFLTGPCVLEGTKAALVVQLVLRTCICCVIPPLCYWLFFHRSRMYILSLPWLLDRMPLLKRGLGKTEAVFRRMARVKAAPGRTSLTEAEAAAPLPLLKQWDSRWGTRPYGGSSIGISGSLPVCLSIAVMSLQGKRSCTPDAVAAFRETCREAAGDEEAAFIKSFVRQHSLHAEWTERLSAEQARSSLGAGDVLICLLDAGKLVDDAGHFVLMTDLDQETAAVHDPLSAARTIERVSFPALQEQALGWWLLSKA